MSDPFRLSLCNRHANANQLIQKNLHLSESQQKR